MAFEERTQRWKNLCAEHIGNKLNTPKDFFNKGFEEALRWVITNNISASDIIKELGLRK